MTSRSPTAAREASSQATLASPYSSRPTYAPSAAGSSAADSSAPTVPWSAYALMEET